MEYKLICIDMDGTLLNKQHKVSEASKEAIKKAHDKGVHIVISTGRMYVDAREYSDFVGVKSPVIASNGAIIKEKDRNEVIYKSTLGEELNLKLLDVVFKHKLDPMFATPETSFGSSFQSKLVIEYLKLKGVFNKNMIFKYVRSRKQLESIVKREKDNIIKCEVISRNIQKIEGLKKELRKFEDIEIACSTKYNIEITCKGVSKGRAVELLGSYYNIPREQIIAIGDSENDLSMIEYAGLGVAMGNAPEEIKQKADYVTDDNGSDGVAKAIERFVLGNVR
jgi:Cof subfamily protein (haloacid dehalogenase superfamily)